jgi:type I restriction enzyme S subunit
VESKDQDPKGSIRLLQLADIGDGEFVDKSHRFINEEKFAKLRCTEVLERDILIARMPDPLGRACIAPKLKQRCITVVDIAILRPGKSSVLPECLMHFINSPDIREFVEREATGSTRKRIARGKLNEMEMPIPPLAEQKRIADKLEAVLGRVDACRARLDRVPFLLKRFRQSVLAAATSGKLTEQWREETNTAEGDAKTLGQVIKVSSGKALTAKNMAADGSIPVFGGNGINGYHDEGNVIEETLVIGRVGYYCGCVHMTPQVAWVTDNALIVRHDATESSKRYLFYALQALDLRTNDAATAQPVISGQKIYSLLLTLPTLPEQQEIVRRVEDLFAFADRIEARLATAQKTVERLTPATLAKAFRGELVPQDPSDEPASVLLKRLRSSEPSAPAGRGRRKAAK